MLLLLDFAIEPAAIKQDLEKIVARSP
jgi:hypothetical protein